MAPPSANGKPEGFEPTVISGEVTALPALIKQPNGGSLYAGGVPGHRGGSGRKPAAWKAACEQALDDAKAVPVLKAIISGDILEQLGTDDEGKPIYGQTKNSDRLGAIKYLSTEAWGPEPATIQAAGQIETPDGYKFTLVIGERDGDSE